MATKEKRWRWRSESSQRNHKGLTHENNTCFKSTQADDNALKKINNKIKRKHRSSSLSQTQNESNAITACKEEENRFNSNKPNDIKSLFGMVKALVSDQMIRNLKEKQDHFKKRSMSVKELKCHIDSIKRTYDENTQYIYSLFENKTKSFYLQTRMRKEEVWGTKESNATLSKNGKMKKEIEMLDSKTRDIKINTLFMKRKLKISSMECNELSLKISGQIEDKKSLMTHILMVRKRIDELNEIFEKRKRDECNIGQQLTQIIDLYSQ